MRVEGGRLLMMVLMVLASQEGRKKEVQQADAQRRVIPPDLVELKM